MPSPVAHDSLRRTHQRRSETIAMLLALDSDVLAGIGGVAPATPTSCSR